MENMVRKIRKAKGMSQEELAKKSGLARSALSYIEQCKDHYPSTRSMEQLAEALGCTIADLYRPPETEAKP